MRIAVLVDLYDPKSWGGVQTHIQNLTKTLELKYGCSTELFFGTKPGLLSRLWWNLTVIPKVFHHHHLKPFDLIHAHSYTAGLSGKILSLLLRRPVVFTVHGSNNLDLAAKSEWQRRVHGNLAVAWFKWFFEWLLLTRIRYAAVISVAQNFLTYPNRNSPIHIIPNGVDTVLKPQKFRPVQPPLHFVSIGRLDGYKAVDDLLHALAQLPTDLPPYHCRIIGGGPHRAVLETLTLTLKLTDKVSFSGSLSPNQISAAYHHADLLILTSLTEGQPMTILEAWAHQVPVLVTRVGHNPWLVKEGVTGYLVPPGDIKALAQALTKAIRNYPRWSRLGQAGHELVKKDHTWFEVAKETLAVYRTVLPS